MTPPKHSLLEGDVAPHLRRLSLPLALGMVGMTIASLADTYFLSHLGTRALASIGFTLPMVMFFLGVTFGLSIGTSSVLARVYGEGDFEKMRQMSTDTLVLTALITTCASVFGVMLMTPAFVAMGAKDDILSDVQIYMAIWYIGLPFFGLTMVANACIRATGDTRYPAAIMLTMSGIQILINPFLIFGWGPFPMLGFSGAATSLLVSYIVTSGISFYFLIVRKKILSPVLWHVKTVDSWKRFLHIAVPAMISNQIAPLSAAIITAMAAIYGKEAVAALGVAKRVEGMCILIFYALGAGVSIFVGQNFGAGNFGRIAAVINLGARWSLTIGFIMALVIWPFAAEIAEIFDKNPKVIAYTTQYFHWVPISFGVMGVMVLVNGALNAMGRPLIATSFIILNTVILYVPLAWLLQKQIGFLGIVIALTMTNLFVGLLSFVYSRRGIS